MRTIKIFENYMKFIGPLSNLMFFMQAYKIYSTQTSASISVPGFLLSLVGCGSWLMYGFFLKNKPIIISNLVGVTGAILVLLGALVYN